MVNNQEKTIKYLNRAITRRQAIRAGGIAVVGLAFSKPLIETILPKPAFANYIAQSTPTPGPTPTPQPGPPCVFLIIDEGSLDNNKNYDTNGGEFGWDC